MGEGRSVELIDGRHPCRSWWEKPPDFLSPKQNGVAANKTALTFSAGTLGEIPLLWKPKSEWFAWGCPGGSDGKSILLQRRRPGFHPWVGKIPWRRVWQPTPVFLPGESPWAKEPGGLQSMRLQRVRHDWATKHTHTYNCHSTVIVINAARLQEKMAPASLLCDFPGGSDSKASAYSAGDLGSIPGAGRSPGEGNGNPLQYSCPETRGAW